VECLSDAPKVVQTGGKQMNNSSAGQELWLNKKKAIRQNGLPD